MERWKESHRAEVRAITAHRASATAPPRRTAEQTGRSDPNLNLIGAASAHEPIVRVGVRKFASCSSELDGERVATEVSRRRVLERSAPQHQSTAPVTVAWYRSPLPSGRGRSLLARPLAPEPPGTAHPDNRKGEAMARERISIWWYIMLATAVATFVLFAVLSLNNVAAAQTQPHYTDGTEEYPPCPAEGPVPGCDLGHPIFGDVTCETIPVDPPQYIWATVHYDFTDDGTFVTELADVFPYDRPGQAWINRDNLGGAQWMTLRVTWNIGSGWDEAVVDCTPPPEPTTTTTTTAPPPPTTPEPPQTSSVPPLAPVTTGVPPEQADTLPETGSTTFPLAVMAAGLIAAGTGMAIQARRAR